ncbi:MoaD/ThiS family protein [Georgenia sunbinii]|uniref:MoaD/ThiS family protein n=1 Tax=Georgenia sunbinii TaxID=3117728 RepID=UPI002F264FBA
MSTIRYFAAAAEAAGRADETVSATTVAELRSLLAEQHGAELARVLTRCAILVNGERSDDGAALTEADVVDVLPPFAGG